MFFKEKRLKQKNLQFLFLLPFVFFQSTRFFKTDRQMLEDKKPTNAGSIGTNNMGFPDPSTGSAVKSITPSIGDESGMIPLITKHFVGYLKWRVHPHLYKLYKWIRLMDTGVSPTPKIAGYFRFRKPSILGTWNSWWPDDEKSSVLRGWFFTRWIPQRFRGMMNSTETYITRFAAWDFLVEIPQNGCCKLVNVMPNYQSTIDYSCMVNKPFFHWSYGYCRCWIHGYTISVGKW